MHIYIVACMCSPPMANNDHHTCTVHIISICIVHTYPHTVHTSISTHLYMYLHTVHTHIYLHTVIFASRVLKPLQYCGQCGLLHHVHKGVRHPNIPTTVHGICNTIHDKSITEYTYIVFA